VKKTRLFFQFGLHFGHFLALLHAVEYYIKRPAPYQEQAGLEVLYPRFYNLPSDCAGDDHARNASGWQSAFLNGGVVRHCVEVIDRDVDLIG